MPRQQLSTGANLGRGGGGRWKRVPALLLEDIQSDGGEPALPPGTCSLMGDTHPVLGGPLV